MKISKILFLLGLIFLTHAVAFGQGDDDDLDKKHKKNKLYVPKAKQSSGVKNSKGRKDLFRNETFKSTQPNKKAQAKTQRKKHKKSAKKYKKTRGDLQNKSTTKRMKHNERMSKKINSKKTIPLVKRVGMRARPTTKKRMHASRKRSNELDKRNKKARDRYDSTYTPVSKKKKKKKMRAFYNPFKKKKF